MKSEENLRKRIKSYFQALNKRDGKKFVNLLSMELRPKDSEAEKVVIIAMKESFSRDWEYKIEEIEIKGDEAKVILEYSFVSENPEFREMKRTIIEETKRWPSEEQEKFLKDPNIQKMLSARQRGKMEQIWVFERENWYFKRSKEISEEKERLIDKQSLPLTVIDDSIVKALSKKGLYSKQNGNNNKSIVQNLQFTNPNFTESPSIYYIQSTYSPNPSNSTPEPSHLSRLSLFSGFFFRNGKGPNEGDEHQFFHYSFPGQENQKEEELIVTIGDSNWTDYTVEQKFPSYRDREGYKRDPSSGKLVPMSDLIIVYGVAVRFNEREGSGYYLWVEGEEEKYGEKKVFPCKVILEKRVNGRKETLAEKEYKTELWWIRVELKLEGERIEVSVEGDKFFEAMDKDIKMGKIALFRKPPIEFGIPDEFEENLKIRRLITDRERGVSEKEESDSWTRIITENKRATGSNDEIFKDIKL